MQNNAWIRVWHHIYECSGVISAAKVEKKPQKWKGILWKNLLCTELILFNLFLLSVTILSLCRLSFDVCPKHHRKFARVELTLLNAEWLRVISILCMRMKLCGFHCCNYLTAKALLHHPTYCTCVCNSIVLAKRIIFMMNSQKVSYCAAHFYHYYCRDTKRWFTYYAQWLNTPMKPNICNKASREKGKKLNWTGNF